MAATGKGYAKVILFGEHFVVYGLPGIACGINKFVQIDAQKVKDSDDVIFDDKVFNEKISLKENPDHIKCKLFNAMFKDEEFVPKKGLKFTINSTFAPGGGMGYSAALCVALARAMNTLTDQAWKDEKINELAYKGETISHGTPSGIDNTCATYGTTIIYEKSLKGEKDKLKPIKCASKLYLVITDTSAKRDIKEIVAQVKKSKEANPSEYKTIFSDYKQIMAKVKQAMNFGETEEIGKLMNQNQILLKKIGVTFKESDEIIRFATFENCLGAKITGESGNKVLILCADEKQQDKVSATLDAKGYKSIKAKIN